MSGRAKKRTKRRKERRKESAKTVTKASPLGASESKANEGIRPMNENTLSFFSDEDQKLGYLEKLVSKQLDLYDWCEEKVSTLATIDAILIGGATLFLDKIRIFSPPQGFWQIVANITVGASITIPLFVSLAITLWHIRPKMGHASTHSPHPNHRSSNGIHQFKSNEEYKKYLGGLTKDDICNDLIKQIYGMNNNIWKNQKSIKIAVAFDLIGLLFFLIVILVRVAII